MLGLIGSYFYGINIHWWIWTVVGHPIWGMPQADHVQEPHVHQTPTLLPLLTLQPGSKKKVYSCSRKTVHHLSSMDCPRNCTHFMNWTMLHTLSRGHRYNMLFHAVPSSGIGANHQTLAGPSCDRQTFLGRPRGVLAAPLREFFARSTQRDQCWRSRPWKIRKTAMCILIHHVCHRYQHPKISNY